MKGAYLSVAITTFMILGISCGDSGGPGDGSKKNHESAVGALEDYRQLAADLKETLKSHDYFYKVPVKGYRDPYIVNPPYMVEEVLPLPRLKGSLPSINLVDEETTDEEAVEVAKKVFVPLWERQISHSYFEGTPEITSVEDESFMPFKGNKIDKPKELAGVIFESNISQMQGVAEAEKGSAWVTDIDMASFTALHAECDGGGLSLEKLNVSAS